jgi:putative ABC transport system permease protein
VSFSLLAFGVAEWSAAATNRFTQAAFLDGAARVLTVHVRPGRNLRAAVDEADPTGRYAMAVERVISPTENLVAVDSTRFARVAEWPSDLSRLSPAQVAKRLHPPELPPLSLTGTRLRLAAAVSGRPAGGPSLTASVFDQASQSSSTVNFGRLRPGAHQYLAHLAGICTTGCRLEDVQPVWPGRVINNSRTESVKVVLTSMQFGGPTGWRAIPGLTARLANPAAWQGASASVARAHGLLVDYRLGANGSQPSLAPADFPAPLPVATTPSVVADSDATALGVVPGVGLDANSIDFRPAAVLPTLPAVGTSGLLVDLGYAQLAQTAPAQNTVDEVWLAAAAPPDALHRLRAAGLVIVGQVSAGAQAAAAGRSGPALGDVFFLLTAAVAGVLAMGAVLVVQLTERRRRAVETAALRAAGLRWRALRGALVSEQFVFIGWASLAGAAAGIGAAALTLPLVPGVDRLTGGPPLAFPLPAAALAASLAALFVALLTIASVGAAATLRAARRPDMLRIRPSL